MNELFASIPSVNAVYWCTYKNHGVPQSVAKLLKQGHSNHWFQVKTEGFDEFMDELVNQLDFSLPGVTQSMQALIEAIPGRIEGSNSRYVLKYFDEAIQQLRREEEELANAYGGDAIQRTPYRLRLEAMYARLRRQYDKAIELYRLLRKLPNQGTCEILIEHAVTLELMDKYAEVLELLPIIEAKVESPDDLGNYGGLLANIGKYSEGIAYIEQAIRRAPGLKQWQAVLARILSEDGQIGKAIEYSDKLIDAYLNDSQMLAVRSMIYSAAGRFEEDALPSARKAIDINGTGLVENLSLATALSAIGLHGEAIEALAPTIPEDDEDRLRALGYSEMLVGEAQVAHSHLERARALESPATRAKTVALYGLSLLMTGDREKAQTTFEEAITTRNRDRHYKADDQMAYALCELAAGQSGVHGPTITQLSTRFSHMRGLLLETNSLLAILVDNGIPDCEESVGAVNGALHGEE